MWTQQQKLTASDAAAGDTFGESVSVSGDTAVVGAHQDNHAGGSLAGSAYVFVRTGGVWTQQQKLTALDAASGDLFGVSVSASGDTAVVGADDNDDAGGDSGSAYVFVRSGTVWTQQQKLTASDAAAGDTFGISVSVSGDTAVVGAWFDDNAGSDSGSAYVFQLSCLAPCSPPDCNDHGTCDDGTCVCNSGYAGAACDQCAPEWASGFGVDDQGMNARVFALTVFDDQTGPALYAGGEFTTAGGISANRIAKWNGLAWSALGSGTDAAVSALIVFDDGTGPALYAGGNFTTAGGDSANRIAKWNGSAWSALGSGMNDAVFALTVFDDGTGPALYAGGNFTTAGGGSANRIAKWNGSVWSALSSGMETSVFALTVFDAGIGPELYAGGLFSTGGGSANYIAKWNPGAPGTWSTLGSGMSFYVRALTVFDDGTGPAMYAGGGFITAEGVSANHIAKWTPGAPGAWSALGNGTDAEVSALTVFDDGTGPALYVGGAFSTAGGGNANDIARWNGSVWSGLSSGVNSNVYALTGLDDGKSPALYAGGEFNFAGGLPSSKIAKWSCPSPMPPTRGDDVCSGGANNGQPCSLNSECPGGSCGMKSRYISITPTNAAVAGGGNTSIQVEIVSMPQFAARVGEIWWVGVEQNVANSPNPSLRGAPLVCSPTPTNAQVWTNGVLHFFGTSIVPGSAYNVRMCDASGAVCSDPLLVGTGKWGDVIAAFGGGSQPNFGDVSAIVAKFGNVASAPNTARTDLVGPQGPGTPNTPNQSTNFADVSNDVSAFSGFAYPYTVVSCPP